MIIECTACHTRFRLDESKIKGKGARVRCRRCGESILVLKTADTGGMRPEKPAAESLDLRSIVRDTLGERPAATPPATTETVKTPEPSSALVPPVPMQEGGPPPPADSAPEAGEPPAAAPVAMTAPEAGEPPAAAPVAEAAPIQKDEVDAAFEEFLVPSTRVPVPAEAGFPTEAGTEASGEAEAATVHFQPEEKMEIPEMEFGDPPPEPSVKETQVPEVPEPAESSFLMTSSDPLGFLSQGQEKEPPRKALDISTRLREEPEIPEAAPEPPLVAPPTDFLTQESEPPPMEKPVESAPPPPPEKVAPVAADPVKPKLPEPRKAAPPLIRPSLVALILLFLALAGGGAYLGFTESGQESLRSMIPGMESLWLQGKGKSAVQYDVRNLIGYYERETTAGNMFIIKGQVTNVGRTRKTGTRVHAALLDANDKTLADKTCYAGNVIPGDELRTSSREKIDEKLSNRFGDGLANMDVSPGKTVSFMVVFFDAPDGINAYRLEAKEGE